MQFSINSQILGHWDEFIERLDTIKPKLNTTYLLKQI